MTKNLIERINKELVVVDETSPVAQCYNFILGKLKKVPEMAYAPLVNEAVEMVGREHKYCDTTRALLSERLMEINN